MEPMLAIGLMSGTSLDGIDAALLLTDGEAVSKPMGFVTRSYSQAERAALHAAAQQALAMERPGSHAIIDAAERLLDVVHVAIVGQLLAETGAKAAEIAVIGYHGQTIAHRPAQGWTWQIGDGAALSEVLEIPIVGQLRTADVVAGGQGAPLLPVYHRALCAGLPMPVAVLNLGGVGNITWIGEEGIGEGDAIVAFDSGPANGLVNSWVEEQAGKPYDADGALAVAGSVDGAILAAMLDNPWFDAPAPKSLDRHDFTIRPVAGLSLEDGAATLTRFTAETVARGLALLPDAPKRLIVAGGGRHNPVLMRMIGEACGLIPEPIEALGWNGDATEAEGFAYMAVRSLRGLPISFPGTTGVPRPMTGGTLHRPKARAA